MEVTHHKTSRFGLNTLLVICILYAAPGRAQQYTLTQIPVPDLSSYPPSANVSGAYVIGYGLNNSGQVVGNVGGIIGYSPVQPFFYDQGSSQLLPYLAKPADWATAVAINVNGITVGESENSDGQGNAVSWQNDSITFLGSLYYITGIGSPPPAGYSSAVAINSKGDAVGSALAAAGGSTTTDTHAVLFSSGTVTDLGTLGGNDSEALGINDSGVIVGDAQTSSESHAFYYDGTMLDLGVLSGGHESSARAINASGTIVGQSSLVGGTHAVLWATDKTGNYIIHDLGSLGPLASNFSQANAINKSGQIVGISTTAQNGQTAFIYSNGMMTDLNSLIPSGSSISLYEATAINDSGQIVAYSINFSTNVRTTYLLTPVPTLRLSATSLGFAQQAVGSKSAAQTVTLTNSGVVTVSFTSISVTGAQSDDYTLSKTCGTTLAPGSSCAVALSFKPVSIGGKSAVLTLADSATGSPQSVKLTGTGVAAGAVLSLSATSLTFPATAPNISSAAQTVTIKNTGAAAATISSIAITGAQADDYNLTKTCGSTLVAGSSCAISITFKPVSSGVKSAVVSITDNASGSPQSVTLKGTGAAGGATLSLSPGSVTYPATKLGTSSAPQKVIVLNTGNVPASLTSIVIAGAQADDYSLTKTCGATLGAGATCTVTIVFKPVSTGVKSATVTFTDSAAGSPQSVALKGTGT